MMHAAMNVRLRTSTEGHPISPRVHVQSADLIRPALCGWGGFPQLTGLKIRTITLTVPSQIQDQSSHSPTTAEKVAKIRHETDVISYWIDDDGPFKWTDTWEKCK